MTLSRDFIPAAALPAGGCAVVVFAWKHKKIGLHIVKNALHYLFSYLLTDRGLKNGYQY